MQTSFQPSKINRPRKRWTMEQRPMVMVVLPIIGAVIVVLGVCLGLPKLLSTLL